MACGNNGLVALALALGGAPATAAHGGAAACSVLRADVAAGATLTAADAAPVPCDRARKSAPIRFDRVSRMVIAAGPIAAGSYLGRLSLPDAAVVRRGETLSLRSRAGPVAIERAVVAMQTARSGGRAFVRDADGHVFAVAVVLTDASAR